MANGLDPSEFAVDLPIEERDAHRVLMLYHESRWKGSTEGLAALAEVRKRVPTLRSCLFGVSPAPDHLPGWITYVRNPSRTKLRALYNEAAIFLSPSWTEGWPLPPAEAMMSGCALVATDIAGHREYAEHDVTALLAPAGQPQALAEQLALLLTDDSYRRRIAAAGLRFIAQFTWDRAVSSLESILAADDREPGAPLLGGSLAA